MCSACENKNYENLNDQNFCMNFDLLALLHMVKIEYGLLAFCQISEQPIQRLLISCTCTIETEAKKAHDEPGATITNAVL